RSAPCTTAAARPRAAGEGHRDDRAGNRPPRRWTVCPSAVIISPSCRERDDGPPRSAPTSVPEASVVGPMNWGGNQPARGGTDPRAPGRGRARRPLPWPGEEATAGAGGRRAAAGREGEAKGGRGTAATPAEGGRPSDRPPSGRLAIRGQLRRRERAV